jgi:hypothetical protein
MLLPVRFEISMVVAMKIIVFRDMTPFSLENRYKFSKESVAFESRYNQRVHKIHKEIHFLRQINPLHNVLVYFKITSILTPTPKYIYPESLIFFLPFRSCN